MMTMLTGGHPLLSVFISLFLFLIVCGQRVFAVEITNATESVVQEKAVVSPDQPSPLGNESEWNDAMALLKFGGSMKMGGQQVAIVNGKILKKGDAISVTFHEKDYRFIVVAISSTGVEYQRGPQQKRSP